MQELLFENENVVQKTYRAIRHDVVRNKQKENSFEVHHPDEKLNQIEWVLNNLNIQKGHEILELFLWSRKFN
jgi:hypothetical protein